MSLPSDPIGYVAQTNTKTATPAASSLRCGPPTRCVPSFHPPLLTVCVLLCTVSSRLGPGGPSPFSPQEDSSSRHGRYPSPRGYMLTAAQVLLAHLCYSDRGQQRHKQGPSRGLGSGGPLLCGAASGAVQHWGENSPPDPLRV